MHRSHRLPNMMVGLFFRHGFTGVFRVSEIGSPHTPRRAPRCDDQHGFSSWASSSSRTCLALRMPAASDGGCALKPVAAPCERLLLWRIRNTSPVSTTTTANTQEARIPTLTNSNRTNVPIGRIAGLVGVTFMLQEPPARPPASSAVVETLLSELRNSARHASHRWRAVLK